MEYFGCIAQDEFDLLSKEDQITFLLSKDIYTTINEFENIKIGHPISLVFDDSTKRHVPDKMVQEQLYHFVVKHYSEFVSQQFYNFYIDFNEKKYGLKKSKQKKLALKFYKHYYDQAATKAVAIVTQRNLENGGIVIESIDKLAFLKEQQNALKSNLSKTVLLQQFLFGNKDFFVASRISEFKILSEIIDFEASWSILLSLNGQYHFEGGISFFTSNEGSHEENTTINSTVLQPHNSIKEPKRFPHKQGATKTNIRTATKAPHLSNEDAIQYLIENVFSKVLG